MANNRPANRTDTGAASLAVGGGSCGSGPSGRWSVRDRVGSEGVSEVQVEQPPARIVRPDIETDEDELMLAGRALGAAAAFPRRHPVPSAILGLGAL